MVLSERWFDADRQLGQRYRGIRLTSLLGSISSSALASGNPSFISRSANSMTAWMGPAPFNSLTCGVARPGVRVAFRASRPRVQAVLLSRQGPFSRRKGAVPVPLSCGWRKPLPGSQTRHAPRTQGEGPPSQGPGGPSPSRILGGLVPGTARSRARRNATARAGYHRCARCEPGGPHQGGEVVRVQGVTGFIEPTGKFVQHRAAGGE